MTDILSTPLDSLGLTDLLLLLVVLILFARLFMDCFKGRF